MGNHAPRPATAPARHALSVDEFVTLADSGAFERFARAELIDGEIFTVNAIHVPHAGIAFELAYRLRRAIDDHRLSLVMFSPVSVLLDDTSLPEPDIVVVQPPVGDRFVAREAIRIAIEVSDSSLRHDLGRKASLYARSGVPEYWVVDVVGRTIIRLHGPDGEAYTHRDEFAFGATIASATIASLTVDTARLG